VIFPASPIGPLVATGAKGTKLPLKFYVKAAGNVSSVKTEKGKESKAAIFWQAQQVHCCTITVLHTIRSKKMGLSGPCRSTIVVAGPRQVAGLSMCDEGLMSRRE
jgi:hypothetical protein